MSIFGSIMGKIFGTGAQAQAAGAATSASAGAAPASAAATSSPSSAPAQSMAAPTTTSGAAQPMAQVDVSAILDEHVSKSGQKLDWRHSIVDLMKALGLDSSLNARKELATELHYSGDANDSATMNMWLHKQVMQKFAAKGGKVPDDLKA